MGNDRAKTKQGYDLRVLIRNRPMASIYSLGFNHSILLMGSTIHGPLDGHCNGYKGEIRHCEYKDCNSDLILL